MKIRRIEAIELADNVIELIGNQWMLVSAGSVAVGFNTMTASWGGIGYLWNKPVAYVFIRPERYTFDFVEREDYFTLTFYAEQYRKVLAMLGSRSGRDGDKVVHSGLTPYFTELGTPAFEQARLTIECRKMYGQMMSPECFTDTANLEKWYGAKGGLHKMYVAEIVNVWVKE